MGGGPLHPRRGSLESGTLEAARAHGVCSQDMLLKIGDVDADEAFNEKISPLYHVDKIVAPLLIGQGANDPRVKQAEADQIAFSMAKKDIPVEYVLYPDLSLIHI